MSGRRKNRNAKNAGPPLILASQSPRREKILRHLGVSFRVVKPAGVQENSVRREPPRAMVERLALKKALEVSSRFPGSLVLGSDTVVVFKGRTFGKPENRLEASRMLTALSGRSHEVWTGAALVGPGAKRPRVHSERTKVFFNPITQKSLSRYLSSREPYDKAGGYDIQGTGRQWIRDWTGSYFNIMGLPAEWVLAQLTGRLTRA